METNQELNSPKQCDNEDQILYSNVMENTEYHQSHALFDGLDEPIDLTLSPTDFTYSSTNDNNFQHLFQGINYNTLDSGPLIEPNQIHLVNEECKELPIQPQKPNEFCPTRKKKRRKFVYSKEGNIVMVTEEYLPTPPDFTQEKQLEILKAAKSLFSKRTRTLYHWMYPDASKQQIKTIVMASWDSLAESEKTFYISQVLGRFGLTQSNLMVNPQLNIIKEPPPLVERPGDRKSRELQSAISSISPENGLLTIRTHPMTFEEFEQMSERTKKRRGRPKGGSNNVKKAKNVNGDFHDDPELSAELEKFATIFNLNRLC